RPCYLVWRLKLKVPWRGNRCIVCLKVGSLCEEHFIPQALGGCISSDFLCSSCNSKLGHDLEHAAKSDPSVLLAVKHLSRKIPDLSKKLLESHPHIGHSQLGPAPGYIRNGEFRVRHQSRDDGSIIQPTLDASKSIATILRRSRYDESPIRNALEDLQQAPENKQVELVPGLKVTKWRTDRIELDIGKAKMMNPLIPAKIAFEFLACHAGTAIYDAAPQLSAVRQTLHDLEIRSEVTKIERLTSNKYEPFHGICFEGNDPHAKVLIRLFGWLAFRVHFLRLSIGGPRSVYTHRLDTNKEHLATFDDLKHKRPRNEP
ncbi:MAG: HNH endonuclease, partial [Rhodospirillales bacterium]